jgi:hypothetical protein
MATSLAPDGLWLLVPSAPGSRDRMWRIGTFACRSRCSAASGEKRDGDVASAPLGRSADRCGRYRSSVPLRFASSKCIQIYSDTVNRLWSRRLTFVPLITTLMR